MALSRPGDTLAIPLFRRRRGPAQARARGLMPGLAGALALAGLAVSASPAFADLRMCNTTDSRIGVSRGYRDPGGWVTEGWWNIAPRSCEILQRGELSARYMYVFAVDYDRGGEWSGRSFMCTREREFTIRGVEDCLARGFDRSGFIEIDTGEQKGWTIQLTDPSRAPSGLGALTGAPGTSVLPR